MTDPAPTNRTRSPINALKVLNELRAQKGLPKVSTKAKAVATKKKLTKEEKQKLAQQVWKDLYPEWNKKDFIIPEDANKKVIAEYSKRLTALEK